MRALAGDRADPLQPRTAVAAYSVTRFAVPRPRALLGDENLRRLSGAARAAGHGWKPAALRLAGAGADSRDFLRLRSALGESLSLPVAPDGDLVVRVVRSPGRDGWDALVRLTPRPLSARPWRVCDMRGALNATIAAAMVRLAQPKPGERALNLMSGSGTLMAEHVLVGGGPITGIDSDRQANSAAAANLGAAGAGERCSLVLGDVGRLPVAGMRMDLTYCDLPYGQAVGSHADNDTLYSEVLSAVERVSTRDARFIVITHDMARLEAALRGRQWRVERELQVFQKGHHPRIWVLRRHEVEQ